MFCDSCGNALQAGQGFCSRCGKKVTNAPVIGYPISSRVQGHIRLVGILWLAFSAFEITGALVLIIIANTIFLHLHGGPPPEAKMFLHPFLSFIGIVIAIKAAAGFLAGWGLLQREPWARVLALVLACLALFHIPFGTALGIYTLWVLLPAQSEQEYEQQTRAVA